MDVQPVRRRSRSVSTSVVGADRVADLRPVWAALHEHHALLQERGRTRTLGDLRDLESSWRAQRVLCERALGSGNAFLVLAEDGPIAVGYALVGCRRHPLWSKANFGSLEVLCVRPTGSGSPSFGALLSRGRILRALLLASIQEGRRRDLSHWSAIAMEANADIRSAMERLGGERAFVTYRGVVEVAARRLESAGSRARRAANADDRIGARPIEGSPREENRERRRDEMTDRIHEPGRGRAREPSTLGPDDLPHLRKILRFYPGAEEILHVLRRIAPIGFPINSFADLEDSLGGPEVTIRIGGRPTPLHRIRRFVPMHYFPVANENDLIAKFFELRRLAASAARQARGRRPRAM